MVNGTTEKQLSDSEPLRSIYAIKWPTIEFTLDRLVAEVRSLAADCPDVVYSPCGVYCMYTKGEAGCGVGCIVGQAILRLQPELREGLVRVDRRELGNTTAMQLMGSMRLWVGTESGKEAYRNAYWLSRVQTSQDRGTQWGECIELADNDPMAP